MAALSLSRPDRASLALLARRTAYAATLALPASFMYARSVSEVLVGMIGSIFLVRSAVRREWAWLRDGWVIAAGVWWAWMIFCSSPIPSIGLGESGSKSLIQALVLGRFFIFTAALATWLLRDPGRRRTMLIMIGVTALWIIVECWQQYLFGRNILGWHRWGDGALTGPFWQPRAGPELVLILFPAILPPTYALLRRRQGWARALGVTLFAIAIATMVLIGQRMPALLTGLGLLTCAIALPRLRPVAIGAGAVAACLLIATPIVSPPTFQKLVVHFSQQMRHFPESDYGKLYIRATVIGLDHPYTGLGFDGFRQHCNAPEFQHGLPALGIQDDEAAGPAGCNIHPHNHYLEAFTAGGIPGLVMFTMLAVCWLAALARGPARASPEQVGCFIAALLALWPFASTSAFFTLPNAGWLFLVLGVGLSLTRPRRVTVSHAAGIGYALPAGD